MWLLRQPIEGDRFITVNNVSDAIGECWIDTYGDYVPNTIAIRINNVEYILPSVHDLQLGFLTIKIPNSVELTEGSTVQVYSKCNSDPQYITLVQLAKPAYFVSSIKAPTTCDPEVLVSGAYNEWIRVFIPPEEGEYFDFSMFSIHLGGSNVNGIGLFDYQPGNTGNVSIDLTSSAGFGRFSRPANWSESAYLFCVLSFGLYNTTVSVKIIGNRYFTVRTGYLELIFKGTSVYYVNYLSDNFEEVYLSDYIVGDLFQINFGFTGYTILKNGIIRLDISKKVSYSVSAGSISPAIANVGTASIWTLPPVVGTYTVTSSFGQSIKKTSVIKLYDCGKANDDHFTGIPNQAFTGNVLLNDDLCDGAITKVRDSGLPWTGISSLSITDNGEFVLVPTTGYTGVSSFIYEMLCGNDIDGFHVVSSANVTIDYSVGCSSTDPVWEDTGRERCINCVPSKEQENTNVDCSGGSRFRWVPSSNMEICSYDQDWQNTNETKCKVTHKYVKQVNINSCGVGSKERWVDVGIDVECECISEIFVTTCCGDAPYYAIVRLLEAPTEENRAITECLKPDLGETCLNKKLLKFYIVNDGLPHTYIITLHDCNKKIINQLILEDLICAEDNNSVFDYVFDFTLTQ